METKSGKMATTEQYSLRWNNFHSNMISGFHQLLEASELVDVTLAVEGHFLHAHKLVLSICSPYFKQMFRDNPCKHPIVILKDVGHENMKAILEFMYVGEVRVLQENFTPFLKTAEMLQIKGLSGDDASDTSSKKDDKLECDNEDEEVLNLQQFDSDDLDLANESTTPPPLYTSPNPKRQMKTSNHHLVKKPKSEPVAKTKSDFEQIIPKIEQNYFNLEPFSAQSEKHYYDSDIKDIKPNWESSIPSTLLDNNPTDQVSDGIPESKAHVFCPFCFRKFVNRYNLKVHIRDKHEDSGTNLDCMICGKVMRNQSCLRVHMYHHRKQMESAVNNVSDVQITNGSSSAFPSN